MRHACRRRGRPRRARARSRARSPLRRAPRWSGRRRRPRGRTASRSPGTAPVATTTSRTGARRWRIEMVAPASPSASSCSFVASRSTSGSPGAASWKVNSSTGRRRRRRGSGARPGRCGRRRAPVPASSPAPTGSSGRPRRWRCPRRWWWCARPAWGTAAPSSSATRCTGPVPGSGTCTTPGAIARGAVHHDGRRRRDVDGGGECAQGLAGERLAHVARLLVAHPHRLDHVVGAARARRIVRAVEHRAGANRRRAARADSRRAGAAAPTAVRRSARGCVRRAPRAGARRRGSTPRP